MTGYPNEPAAARTSTSAHVSPVPASDGTEGTGTGSLNVPDAGTPGRNSRQYHRQPLGVGLTIPVQSIGMGAEVKQAGSGRAFIPATLALPEQSPTPMPDGRRIARPMPTAAHDESQVIRPNG